jgi:uncharacterized membrane protein
LISGWHWHLAELCLLKLLVCAVRTVNGEEGLTMARSYGLLGAWLGMGALVGFGIGWGIGGGLGGVIGGVVGAVVGFIGWLSDLF